jgi:hypothetical protein
MKLSNLILTWKYILHIFMTIQQYKISYAKIYLLLVVVYKTLFDFPNCYFPQLSNENFKLLIMVVIKSISSKTFRTKLYFNRHTYQ